MGLRELGLGWGQGSCWFPGLPQGLDVYLGRKMRGARAGERGWVGGKLWAITKGWLPVFARAISFLLELFLKDDISELEERQEDLFSSGSINCQKNRPVCRDTSNEWPLLCPPHPHQSPQTSPLCPVMNEHPDPDRGPGSLSEAYGRILTFV